MNPNATSPAIQVEGLKKSYGDLDVIKGISFSIHQGEIFSILGPNGAGKTTCIEILEGYRQASAGSISVLGFDPQKHESEFKERIGIVVQTSGVEEELTPLEALQLYGACYKNPKDPESLLEIVGLTAKATSRIGKLSGGQKRKLDLALGLIGDPDLIFLDEPTTGFSPEARREAWDMLKNLQSLGKTILLTSHYMEEVERLADRMIILLNGKIVQEGKPRDLRHGVTRISFCLPNTWKIEDLNASPQKDLIEEISFGSASAESKQTGKRVECLTENPTELVHVLTSRARDEGIELEDLSVQKLNLEDSYLEIINERQ